MPTTDPTIVEANKQINRIVVRKVVTRVATGIGFVVVGSLIANAIDRKIVSEDTESTKN